jgi:uncharacterized coiled-coil protein SlyX
VLTRQNAFNFSDNAAEEADKRRPRSPSVLDIAPTPKIQRKLTLVNTNTSLHSIDYSRFLGNAGPKPDSPNSLHTEPPSPTQNHQPEPDSPTHFCPICSDAYRVRCYCDQTSPPKVAQLGEEFPGANTLKAVVIDHHDLTARVNKLEVQVALAQKNASEANAGVQDTKKSIGFLDVQLSAVHELLQTSNAAIAAKADSLLRSRRWAFDGLMGTVNARMDDVNARIYALEVATDKAITSLTDRIHALEPNTTDTGPIQYGRVLWRGGPRGVVDVAGARYPKVLQKRFYLIHVLFGNKRADPQQRVDVSRTHRNKTYKAIDIVVTKRVMRMEVVKDARGDEMVDEMGFPVMQVMKDAFGKPVMDVVLDKRGLEQTEHYVERARPRPKEEHFAKKQIKLSQLGPKEMRTLTHKGKDCIVPVGLPVNVMKMIVEYSMKGKDILTHCALRMTHIDRSIVQPDRFYFYFYLFGFYYTFIKKPNALYHYLIKQNQFWLVLIVCFVF